MLDSSVQVEIPNRSLFKASEVCDLVKLQPYVLRSWEAEFPDLGVAKADGAPRVYRRADVEQVMRIKHLLLVEGLTLAGARRKLDEEGAPVAIDQPAMVELVREERARAADGGEAGPAVDPGLARAKRRYSGVPAVAAGGGSAVALEASGAGEGARKRRQRRSGGRQRKPAPDVIRPPRTGSGGVRSVRL